MMAWSQACRRLPELWSIKKLVMKWR